MLFAVGGLFHNYRPSNFHDLMFSYAGLGSPRSGLNEKTGERGRKPGHIGLGVRFSALDDAGPRGIGPTYNSLARSADGTRKWALRRRKNQISM
ncbi:hypothetical protein BJL95_11855 [Methylomonas sp. LWB]|nr:hypothetical protein BJL95_11855 [Methylomonas sp. LWB]